MMAKNIKNLYWTFCDKSMDSMTVDNKREYFIQHWRDGDNTCGITYKYITFYKNKVIK